MPMLGLGLIDSIQDREILARQAATGSQRAALGIAGHPNRSGNDGTITRFGWKAQNKSITMFAGEAYNVEMGITNELFPHAKEEDPNCNGPQKPEPVDVTRMDNGRRSSTRASPTRCTFLPDWMQFQLLMRFTDAPQPDPNPSNSAVAGGKIFSNIGCALCHTPHDADRAGGCQRGPTKPAGEPVLRPARPRHGRRDWPTASVRAQPARTSSVRRRYGASDSACSSFTTAEPMICSRRSRPMLSTGSEANAVVNAFNRL